MKKKDYIIAYIIVRWGYENFFQKSADILSEGTETEISNLEDAIERYRVFLGYKRGPKLLPDLAAEVEREFRNKTITQARAIVANS